MTSWLGRAKPSPYNQFFRVNLIRELGIKFTRNVFLMEATAIFHFNTSAKPLCTSWFIEKKFVENMITVYATIERVVLEFHISLGRSDREIKKVVWTYILLESRNEMPAKITDYTVNPGDIWSRNDQKLPLDLRRPNRSFRIFSTWR